MSTGDIVALKKLKMEREKEGFPITSLREINTLLKAQHPNIVTVRVSVLVKMLPYFSVEKCILLLRMKIWDMQKKEDRNVEK